MNRILLIALAAVAAAGLVIAPQRTWANLLIAGFAVLATGLAAAFFLALQDVTGSAWSAALRRVPVAMTAALVPGVAAVLAVVVIAGDLIPREGLSGFKAWWLSQPFFAARAIVYIAIWIALTRAIVRRPRATGLAALFIVSFAFTFWLASYDWLMALDPHFASTIFGVYQFAGMFQAGLAAMILFAVWLERQDAGFRLRAVHLHDLGKLLFAFSTFWMYIWFSQYMLVWYANLAEEANYFAVRTSGAWGALFLATMILNWCVPFVVLLPKRTKKDAATLAKVAAVVLLGRWLDLYVTVMPSLRLAPSAIDIAAPLAAAALTWFAFRRAIAQKPAVPDEDAFVKQSLTYQA